MFDVIIAAGGNSVRAGFDKLNFIIGETTVLQRTVAAFRGIDGINKIIVAGGTAEGTISSNGGVTRSETVKNALSKVEAEYVLVHDGARPFVSAFLIKNIMAETEKHGAAVPVLPVTDTLMLTDGNSITKKADRSAYVTVQTPQGFKTELLRLAFEKADKNITYTDESSMFGEYVFPCKTVPGEIRNKKLTYAEDFFGINGHIGFGYDLHKFTENKVLRLCGTEIPYEYGLLAHSDGDVAIHALMDALLSAAGERDIGFHFPDNDPTYENIDSTVLLKKVLEILKNKNLSVQSVSITIVAQAPKLSPYIEKMRNNLSALLKVPADNIGVSATTTEGTGIIGEKEAIASYAAVILN